jgi:CO/xanthine dehydrogenase FAD-binding subunit
LGNKNRRCIIIPFDFAYYRPDTIAEAIQLYRDLDARGKQPLYYGGGSEIITLANISESDFYPLMSKACSRIADHTMQCKITLAGNICGTIIYKEALLPLLLSECTVIVASGKKLRPRPITEVFNENLRLSQGELL